MQNIQDKIDGLEAENADLTKSLAWAEAEVIALSNFIRDTLTGLNMNPAMVAAMVEEVIAKAHP